MKNKYYGYNLQVDEQYCIMGCFDIINNTSYLGHMINDGGIIDKSDKNFDNYYLTSSMNANCVFTSISGLHMAIVASKDIEIGQELLITYGKKYWEEMDKKMLNL